MNHSPAASTSVPTAEEVRQQLSAILASSEFASAGRASRFLSFVVEQTLAGNHEQIKESVLGTEVFDRPSSFDPKLDTIVRVEAGKLRKRIQQFYAAEGCAAPISIEIPRGTYVPVFQLREIVSTMPAEAALRIKAGPSWRRLRWIAAGLAVAAVLLSAFWMVRTRRAEAISGPPSVAVLPFLSLSPDPNNAYFADGLAEELTHVLSKVRGLRVASRTSAFFFRNKPEDVREIGTRLGVKSIIEGSVRKEGGKLKITAQLIRTDTGYHLWSQTFERDAKDVFAIQQNIAEAIVDHFRLTLSEEQGARFRKRSTENLAAFDLYLQGLKASSDPTAAGFQHAVTLLEKAIAADPGYARPQVALARLYVMANIFGWIPPRDSVAKARAAATRALQIDDDLPDAYAILGALAARHDYDWASAERNVRRALNLDPDSAFAHNELAQNVLAPQGRFDEAFAENRLARELDPLSPLYSVGYPFLLALHRENDRAIEESRKILSQNPETPMVRFVLALALRQKGKFEEAIAEYRRDLKTFPSPTGLAFLGSTLALAGKTGEAREVLSQLEMASHSSYVAASSLLLIHIDLGNREKAFEYLERSRLTQESGLIFAKVGSNYDPIRSDPRFQACLTKIGL